MLDKTYCFGSIMYTVKFGGAKVVAAVVAASACSLAMQCVCQRQLARTMVATHKQKRFQRHTFAEYYKRG